MRASWAHVAPKIPCPARPRHPPSPPAATRRNPRLCAPDERCGADTGPMRTPRPRALGGDPVGGVPGPWPEPRARGDLRAPRRTAAPTGGRPRRVARAGEAALRQRAAPREASVSSSATAKTSARASSPSPAPACDRGQDPACRRRARATARASRTPARAPPCPRASARRESPSRHRRARARSLRCAAATPASPPDRPRCAPAPVASRAASRHTTGARLSAKTPPGSRPPGYLRPAARRAACARASRVGSPARDLAKAGGPDTEDPRGDSPAPRASAPTEHGVPAARAAGHRRCAR